MTLKEKLGLNISSCLKQQAKTLAFLPKVFGAEFVEGFAVFTSNTKKRAIKEMKLIGTYLSKNKNAIVLITLHTPVSGPYVINSLAYRSGLKTAKNVLDARFQSVMNGILAVPGVARSQLKKNTFRYNKPTRVVRFKIIK